MSKPPASGATFETTDDGALHGAMTLYWADGTPRVRATWRHGKLHGVCEVLEGAWRSEQHWADGLPHGRWTAHDAGRLALEKEFESGVLVSSADHRPPPLCTPVVLPPQIRARNGLQDVLTTSDLAAALKALEGVAQPMLTFDRWNEPALPDTVWQQTHLKGLEIRSGIVERLPDDIGKLTALEWLWIQDTPIAEIPEALGALVSLKNLHLPYCSFRSLPDLRTLIALESLDLSNNALLAMPDWMAELPRLSALDLAMTDVEWLPAGIGKLRTLSSLRLSHRITGVRRGGMLALPEEIGGCAALEELRVDGQHVPALPDSLRRLERLRVLSIIDAALVRLPDWLAGMPALQALDVSFNYLTEVPAAFSSRPALPVSVRANPIGGRAVPKKVRKEPGIRDARQRLVGSPIPPSAESEAVQAGARWCKAKRRRFRRLPLAQDAFVQANPRDELQSLAQTAHGKPVAADAGIELCGGLVLLRDHAPGALAEATRALLALEEEHGWKRKVSGSLRHLSLWRKPPGVDPFRRESGGDADDAEYMFHFAKRVLGSRLEDEAYSWKDQHHASTMLGWARSLTPDGAKAWLSGMALREDALEPGTRIARAAALDDWWKPAEPSLAGAQPIKVWPVTNDDSNVELVVHVLVGETLLVVAGQHRFL